MRGANGVGKTSLVEAIYVAATGKSFRAASLADCARRGSDGFSVLAEVEREGRWLLQVSLESGEKRRRVQGREAPLGEHLARLPLVAWTEAEHDLVAGPSLARRRLLDRADMLLRPAAVAEHAALARVLAQKRRLLAEGGSGLEAWNDLLAPLVVRRAERRAELAARLAEALATRLAEAGADLAAPRLALRPSPAVALEGETAVRRALAAAASEERERRQPLLGPQRDRVELTLAAGEARRFASAGERKLLALALLAALARLLASAGRAPLVLLDDAASELDGRRLEMALALFSGAPQVIATSAGEGLWPSPERAVEWRFEPAGGGLAESPGTAR